MKVVVTIDSCVCQSSLSERIGLIKEIRATIPGNGVNNVYGLLESKQLVDLICEKADYLADNSVGLCVVGHTIRVEHLYMVNEIVRIGHALYKVYSDDGEKLQGYSLFDSYFLTHLDRRKTRFVTDSPDIRRDFETLAEAILRNKQR